MRTLIKLRIWLNRHPLGAPYRWLRDLVQLQATRSELVQLRQRTERLEQWLGEQLQLVAGLERRFELHDQALAELQQSAGAQTQAVVSLQQSLDEQSRVVVALQQSLDERSRAVVALENQAQLARAELSWAAPLYKYPDLPFGHVQPAPDWIANAERVLGVRLTDLPAAERDRWFYSFYSEMAGGVGQILRQQYQIYLPLLPVVKEKRVLDIGCGAGEFLDFLRQQGVNALGLDLDSKEVARARSRGLDAIHADARNFFLENHESFSAITLFQVIEHVPATQVESLLSACVDALAPGGALIVETINLRHPNALNGFYTDPTHQRPLSDNYLSFLFQWYGLERVEIIYTLPEWLPGVSSAALTRCYANYTVIGYRSF